MISTTLFTLLKGRQVGVDDYGNTYYIERFYLPFKKQTPRRWVIYKGMKEASKVPAEWHGWLHFTTDTLPEQQNRQPYPWEKPHKPNLTGTQGAYRPPGSILKPKKSKPSYYEAWTP